MTNEEAIKAIKANYPSGGYERLCEALEMAIKALEESRWIPVTDRLPKKTGWYLCTLSGDFSQMVYMCKFDTANGSFWNFGIEYNVVAWMELPKPYEGGE